MEGHRKTLLKFLSKKPHNSAYVFGDFLEGIPISGDIPEGTFEEILEENLRNTLMSREITEVPGKFLEGTPKDISKKNFLKKA